MNKDSEEMYQSSTSKNETSNSGSSDNLCLGAIAGPFGWLTQGMMAAQTFLSLLSLDMESDLSWATLTCLRECVKSGTFAPSHTHTHTRSNHSSDTSRSAPSPRRLMSTTRYGQITRNPASPWATAGEREKLLLKPEKFCPHRQYTSVGRHSNVN